MPLDLIKFIKANKGVLSLLKIAAYPEVHPDAESESLDFENFLDKVECWSRWRNNSIFL